MEGGGTDLTANLLDFWGFGTFSEALAELLSVSLEEITKFLAGSKSRSIKAFNRVNCRLSTVATFGFSIGVLCGNHEAFLVYCFVTVCLTLSPITGFEAELGVTMGTEIFYGIKVFSYIREDRGTDDPTCGRDAMVSIGG